MNSEGTSLRSALRFSEQEDDVLVSIIAPSPSLYDPEDHNYKNKTLKAAHWQAISKIVKRDVESCKRRWKDIKNNYFKIKRQNKTDRCNWSLYEKLMFLEPIYERYAKMERRILSPTNEEGIEGDSSYGDAVVERYARTSCDTLSQDQDSRSGMDFQPSTSSETTVRKRRYEEVSSDEETTSRDRYHTSRGRDDVDLFMRSIALQVKRMPQRKIAQAKVRILTIVNELQFGQLRMGDP